MRILIAETDASDRGLIAMRLAARHYQVLEVEKSEEVLRLLERERIDLVLLSSEMKAEGGKFLIEKIRQIPHLMTLPIILITEEEKIAELVMSQDRGFDDFLTKPFNPLILQLRVAMMIQRARQRVDANALTHLPGNLAIERTIRRKIEHKEKFSVLYIDVNHFKSFNDGYGFEKGDDVIRQTAKILSQSASSLASEEEIFIGHVGGDDFIVVLPPPKEETFARFFIQEFDRIMPTYYDEEDQKRGYLKGTNRQGKRENTPLMSCAVAAVNNLSREYKNLGEIARDAAEVKTFLKSQPGSHYLRDRRSSPLSGLAEAAEILNPEIKDQKRSVSVDPLGQTLLDAGLISEEQLSEALKRHLETGQRLGQVLISMNAVRSRDVGKMLEKKLNIPYVSLETVSPSRQTLRLFTNDFMKSHRVIPIECGPSSLKLGMCDPFDLKTLDAIERITQLKPVPLLALEDEFEAFCEKYFKDSENISEKKERAG